MRIAVISDIHGNLAAFEAVLADLRETSPDLILHGGDLAHGGPAPSEIVDRIRDLAWPGVLGNTDEMLFAPESLAEFAAPSSAPPSLWTAIEEMAVWTREMLGSARLEFLRNLPRVQLLDPLALVHASPSSTWRSPAHTAPDAELDSTYSPLARPVTVYGHIHVPFIRRIRPGHTVINTGAVSMSFDGDPRAAYLLLDDSQPSLRRVEYDRARVLNALASSHLPHADWIAKTIETAHPQMP